MIMADICANRYWICGAHDPDDPAVVAVVRDAICRRASSPGARA